LSTRNALATPTHCSPASSAPANPSCPAALTSRSSCPEFVGTLQRSSLPGPGIVAGALREEDQLMPLLTLHKLMDAINYCPELLATNRRSNP
jgi:hypothetical protein